mmetsp:Transcript_38935/g.100808  ORF Transcript_38935/g.100808 Transcript_38935/m.100808 type:complete len:267 (+) Transcript_38935:822-1622(+)
MRGYLQRWHEDVLREGLLLLRAGGGQRAGLLPHYDVVGRAEVRHHQHRGEFRHSLRGPVLLAVRHRGEAREHAQGLPPRRPRLVHDPLRARHIPRLGRRGPAVAHLRLGGGRGPGASGRGHPPLRLGWLGDDGGHAFHGHHFHGLCRGHRRVFARGLRPLQGLHQPAGRRTQDPLGLKGRDRGLRFVDGRALGSAECHGLELGLGLHVHGYGHRFGRCPFVELAHVEGCECGRRHRRSLGRHDLGLHHLVRRGAGPVGRDHGGLAG